MADGLQSAPLSSFPIARNFYYGVDYREGVNISWYKNIPVPTSYMVAKSNYGTFRVAMTAPDMPDSFTYRITTSRRAKNCWTWGNAEFGYAWDRNLTDADGPYVELMAGAYTDNQPDFSWLHPYETRTFSQYWYPIQEIGPAKNANKRIAISLHMEYDCARIGVCASEAMSVKVVLTHLGKVIYEREAELKPGSPLVDSANCGAMLLRAEALPRNWNRHSTVPAIDLLASGQEAALDGEPRRSKEVATEPLASAEAIATNEELYLIGIAPLQQYRHGTRQAEDYWLEGLKRDRGFAAEQCNGTA